MNNMNVVAFNSLKNGINSFMDDEKVQFLNAQLIRVYGLHDDETIGAALKDWESKGYLRILKNPNEASGDETCVEMLSYIDRKSPWSDWPPRH